MDDNETQDLTAGGPPPGSLSFVTPGIPAEWLAAEMAAAHAPVSGTHSHSHPTYGTQGADSAHEHMHKHDGDAHHGHDHSMKVPARAAQADGWTAAGFPELAALIAAAHAAAPEGSSLVAAAMGALGSPWGIEERGDDGWTVLGRDGDVETFTGEDGHSRAMDALRQAAFADAASRPVLPETWRSEMAFEGQNTPDGRYIDPGGFQYRDCPLPLMLQTTTDIGHFGAVLAGAITQAGTVGQTALGSGEFDDTEAGRQFLGIVQARGQFGVSIDGMSPSEAEYECTERDEDGFCTDGRVVFHLLTIGGVTGTPFPAFPDAYIALENRAATAAGEHHGAEGEPRGEADTPCEDCEPAPATETAAGDRSMPQESALRWRLGELAKGGHIAAGKEDPAAVGKADPETFTAAAGPAALAYPADWFADPRFGDGDDPRLVLQPDGAHFACPLTVTADGRVFGHMASWFTCHTGYANACVTPPRSKSNYAAFRLRPVMTAGGEVVHVGHLTMGCGHAPTAGRMSADAVRAHYDGGPGAVRMAFVACGEDRYGIWFAGGVNPDATPEQVREFAACSVSGDWRDVWGHGLDLVACLAGVTVPGFPVASALAAAGLVVVPREDALPTEPQARMVDGRPAALVAAGVVRRPLPWESLVAGLAHRLEDLEGRLARAELVTQELRPMAAERLMASLREPVAASNGTGG